MTATSTAQTTTRSATAATQTEPDALTTELAGDWRTGTLPLAELLAPLAQNPRPRWRWRAADDLAWDSRLAARLLQVARHCDEHDVELDLEGLPASLRQQLTLARAVPRVDETAAPRPPLRERLLKRLSRTGSAVRDASDFTGRCLLALGQLLRGRADLHRRDVLYFVAQCGPQAIGIVALISVLVGMILAYLGSVQLRQFGAEIYVADLVTIGMVREMGALMTAVIMAGRTGAAYAAQLGAMQANEEVDAITTLGISPVEYLVLPRMIALVAVMPLLCIFSIAIGLGGGALVAATMDVSLVQFIQQARDAATLGDLAGGLFKSLVFGLLIAAAGCQAGLQSGRSSAAVGQATTRAVVNAIVYLVVADAALNILYDKLGV